MRQHLTRLAQVFKQEFALYRCALSHPDTPWLAKLLLGVAVGYVLLPFDLIPDFIPVIGQLDDLVLVPLLVGLALRLIPRDVMTTCRHATNTRA